MRIRASYVLATTIPLVQTADGRYYADKLWYVDLRRHLEHLECLTLACPVRQETASSESGIDLSELCAKGLRVEALRLPLSRWRSLITLPRLVADAARILKGAEICHCHVVGWPIPTAFIFMPVARWRGLRRVIVVESWPTTTRAGLRGRLERVVEGISLHVARWCVRGADVVFYTHRGYESQFPAASPQRGHVVPASWVDETQLRDALEVQRKWSGSTGKGRVLRLVYAGRLVDEKGVPILVEVIKGLRETCEQSQVALEFDFYGEGLCLPMVRGIEGEGSGITVRYRGTLPYGEDFLGAIGQYDVGVVPGVGSEQPRIIFDFFSQGVPVIGFDTPGNAEVVRSGENGRLVATGDVLALRREIERLSADPSDLAAWGTAAWQTACLFTHRAMHQRRAEVLRVSLGLG